MFHRPSMKPLGLGLACFVIGLLTTTGVHAQQVSSRNALGIPAFGHFQWTQPALALLGQEADAEVAKQLGISKASVVAKRQELGIAPVAGAASSQRFEWTDEAVALLGTASDARIAAQLGLSRLTVYNARVARGIAAGAAGRAPASPPSEAG